MTKGEAIRLFRNLNQLGNLSGVKFSYAVARNLNTLKGEIESIEKTLELPDKYKEFDAKRVELAEKHAEKDKAGKPKVEAGEGGLQQFVMGADNKKFEKEFEALKKEYKEAVALREKQIEEYTQLLVSKSEVVLHKLKLDDCPKEISAAQMAGIYEIVEE